MKVRVGIGFLKGRWSRWQSMALEALGDRGIAVDLDRGGFPVEGRQGFLPRPWLDLRRLEAALGRPAFDPLADQEAPSRSSTGEDVALLALPPGLRLGEGGLARLPLGALVFEPVHPERFVPVGGDGALTTPGSLLGGMFWRQAGQPARLAAETRTCVQGPMPLAWSGAHWAKLAAQPARLAARLELDGPGLFQALPKALPLPPYRPGPAAWAAFSARLARYWLHRGWLDLLHRRQWFLAIRPGDGDPSRPDFREQPFAPLVPPGSTGWADPFLFRREGRTWLFVEEIPAGQKGVLSVMEVLPGGGFGPVRRVLEEPFHLSYPNVFEHGGQVYMLPETAGAGQVRLYRAAPFPWRWELDRVLLEGVSATDATLLEHDGVWWMFVSLRRPGGSSWDELHLYRGESRFGPFTPHPLNPVAADVTRSRPAGRILAVGGRLYRPAQDCSGWYGRGLQFMEIVRLDAQGYQERPAARLDASLIPGSFCLHAFDAQGGLEVVDGQRFVPLWSRQG